MWKVLIVDDEPDNRELLAAVLEEHAECVHASTGEQALELFEKAYQSDKHFDIVLLDVAMPGIDGVEVVSRIRSYEEAKGILLGHGTPVIMVTAHPKTFMKSFIGGCDDFISKPVDVEVLVEKISKLLENR